MADETGKVSAQADCSDSVAFSLIYDFFKAGEINDIEVEYLKIKYTKLYQEMLNAKAQYVASNKKCKSITNEIASEKILLEKAKLEEVDENLQLKRLQDTKVALQKELEFTEQKEIMAKFELAELKRMHIDLTADLEEMKTKNINMVEPILNSLRDEVLELTQSLKVCEEAYSKESAQKSLLQAKIIELEKIRSDSRSELNENIEILQAAEVEPNRITRQIGSIETALSAMENEFRILNKKIKNIDAEMEHQVKRKVEAEKLKKSLIEKLNVHSQTIEKREQDVSLVRGNLDTAKQNHHDLVTRKMEFSIKRKDIEDSLRMKQDQYNFAKKDFDNLKRQYKKKRLIADSVKQVIPTLEEQLRENELKFGTYKEEQARNEKVLNKLRDDIDTNLAQFLQQEGFENNKKKELELVIDEVDKLETEVMHWVTEGKRQSKLLSVLSAQRDIKGRDSARMAFKEKEAKQHVQMKELVILDLTKRCNEISNRLKEFSALYEVVKNERNKYVNLIQSSTQALAEMREKIRILNNEVEILGNESSSKDIALNKEKSAHVQAQHQRDALRQDMNRLLSEYRAKQSTVEQQIQEIDKLNIVIGSLEREMLDIKGKYEKAVEERNITGVQLIDRNDELCILFERSNQQQDTLKKGEIFLQKKEAELRLLRLQSEELRRRYITAKLRLPTVVANKLVVVDLETKLANERRKTEEFSAKLEDPSNKDRWRPLDGEDPDPEQLQAKIKVLEDRLDAKREQLLEKELIYEEVSTLTEKLRIQASTKRESSKYIVDELNELQYKIRDITKKMLATVSELSMYQATALRLQQEKGHREKLLEEASWRFDHGEAPFDEAVKEFDQLERKRMQEVDRLSKREEDLRLQQPANMSHTTAEPRPTAYIPDDLGIPKPYGSLAPFKPMEAGATMRHIKQPQIKPIEL